MPAPTVVDDDTSPWARIQRWRTSAALMTAAAIGTALLVLLVAVLVQWPRLQSLDTSGHVRFVTVTTHAQWLIRPARVLSALGVASVIVLICLVVAIDQWRRHRPAIAVWLLGTLLSGWLLTQCLKAMGDRQRPPTNGLYWEAGGPSWPSGHASVGIYGYGALALLAWWTLRGRARGWVTGLLVALGVCIGLSRLVLLVHWPSDVVSGWLVGLLTLLVTGSLLAAWVRRHPQPRHAATTTPEP